MATRLPPEVLTLIFEYCSVDTLKDLRLVDRHFSACSTPLVFNLVHCSVFSKSLNNLYQISRSPLAECVRIVEFHLVTLPDHDYWTWLESVDFRPHFLPWRKEQGFDWSKESRLRAWSEFDDLPRHNLTHEQLQDGWRGYRTLFDEHRDWFREGKSALMRECLANLPNLSETVLLKAARTDLKLETVWKRLHHATFLSPAAMWHGSDKYGYDLAEGASALAFVEAVGHRNKIWTSRPVEKLALQLTTKYTLRNLLDFEGLGSADIERFHESRDTRRSTGQATRYQTVVDTFKPLKHLQLISMFTPDYNEHDVQGQGEETQQLLRGATNLRSLHLQYGEPSHVEEYGASHRMRYSLAPFFSDPEILFPHLYDLKLEAPVPAKLFAKFLSTHSRTLRRLDIQDSISEDWSIVLNTVASDLQLDHIYLEALYRTVGSSDCTHEVAAGEEIVTDYYCYFEEGTATENYYNNVVKAFLLDGEPLPGDIKFPGQNDEIFEHEEYLSDADFPLTIL